MLRTRIKVAGYNATALVSKMRPDFALLSYWGVQTPGYGGAIHMTRDGPLVKENELAPLAMAPFGKLPIYVANEAFGALRSSDGALGEHHGVVHVSTLNQALLCQRRHFFQEHEGSAARDVLLEGF